jgi:hypothetical protein
MPVAATVELSDQNFLVFTQSGPFSEVRADNVPKYESSPLMVSIQLMS